MLNIGDAVGLWMAKQ